jgi:inosine-uridine nucleoside N-ribohydrolase
MVKFRFSLVIALLATVFLTVMTTVPTLAKAIEAEKVIIDSDMGELNDDAMVMFMLAKSNQVNVLGVSIVSGNTWVEEGTAYALRQLELIGRTDIPVLMGASEPLMGNRQPFLSAEETLFGKSQYVGSLSRPRPGSYLNINRPIFGGYPTTKPSDENAVDFIVRQVKANPNQVTLFVIGPATNIALAIKKNPEIVPLIKRVIYMGGAIDIPGNTTPCAEFNWWYDPEAIKICLRTPFKEQIVVPNDVAERVFYTKAQYDRIVNATETPIVRMFKELHGNLFKANPGYQSYVWDSITAAIFLQPNIATKFEERYIDIDTHYGPSYGRSIGYFETRRRSFANPTNFPAGTQKVKILFDINRDLFWDLYINLATKK